MYSAISIAKYIIAHESASNRTVSNLRLQKLLYFVQAQFLVTTGSACFSDPIEAWDFGPVVPTVYHEYKIFGSSNIPCFVDCDGVLDISTSDKSIIDKMVDRCSKYTTPTLVSFTHDQRPWKDAYFRPYKNNQITNESIKSFFEE